MRSIVETHRSGIKEKLGLDPTLELVVQAAGCVKECGGGREASGS
jgi:hypothetical protein